MTVQKDEQITKRVQFTWKDDEQQLATGIVMVPHAVDLQGDWERPETIQQFAEQFANFEEVGEADGGVMHAVWPSEHSTLERNEVLDSDTEIGGETAPEGAWVQSWKIEDGELWSLVDDGILEGYSIGAVDVDWAGPMAQDELPDEVSVSDDFPEDEPVWELQDGIIREVSAVDIPAVPDAMILETKDAEEKRLADHLGNRDGFIEEAQERGHSESDAERLWDYLNRAVDVEGAGEPGAKGRLTAAGKAFLNVLTGSDDGDTKSEALDSDRDPAHDKEGRTLSRQNRESLYATIDASLDVLEDANVDHGMTRFTDRDDTVFDLSEHSAREWTGTDEDEDEDEEEEASTTNSAAGSDTPDTGGTEAADMTDDPNDEPPEWAKTMIEQTNENAKRIEELADGDTDKDGADGGDDDPDKSLEDAPEWAKSLQEGIEKNAEQIETVAKASGTSQQLAGGADTTTDRKTSSAWDKTLGLPTEGDD